MEVYVQENKWKLTNQILIELEKETLYSTETLFLPFFIYTSILYPYLCVFVGWKGR